MNENPDGSQSGPAPLNSPGPAPVATGNPIQGSQPIIENRQSITEVEQITPASRSMEQVPPATEEAKPEKKKKTGLIIGIIVALAILLIGGAVLAVFLINANKKDPVAVAIDKIIDGNAPKYINVDGNIHLEANDDSAPFSSLDINVDSDIIFSSMIHKTDAEVVVNVGDSESFNMELHGIYAGNGNLYLKVDGIEEIVSALMSFQSLSDPSTIEIEDPSVDCDKYDDASDCLIEGDWEISLDEIDYDNCVDYMTNCLYEVDMDTDSTFGMDSIYMAIISALGEIDGQWIKIPVEQLTNNFVGNSTDSGVCVVAGVLSNLKANSNSITSLYKKNPFIGSTSEKVNVAKKNYTVREVTIDNEKFNNFMNSIQGLDFYNEISDCLDSGEYETQSQSGETDSAEVKNLPIYVEVDGDNNFSRIFTTSETESDGMILTIDFSFSILDNVNVSEPENYLDLGSSFQGGFLN